MLSQQTGITPSFKVCDGKVNKTLCKQGFYTSCYYDMLSLGFFLVWRSSLSQETILFLSPHIYVPVFFNAAYSHLNAYFKILVNKHHFTHCLSDFCFEVLSLKASESSEH
ncbi:hypothetical protein GOODEAATRI_013909 [Goodea atripinnis]|uniref:Uncharacterized protein n=1 Tax=Goodea atripinnis TaxID=208336 RepID=A0ABV0NAH2_9TELE